MTALLLAEFSAFTSSRSSRVVDDPEEGYMLVTFFHAAPGEVPTVRLLGSETAERAVWDAVLELGLIGSDRVVLHLAPHGGTGHQVADLLGLLLPPGDDRDEAAEALGVPRP